jgi:hypothetical protein
LVLTRKGKVVRRTGRAECDIDLKMHCIQRNNQNGHAALDVLANITVKIVLPAELIPKAMVQAGFAQVFATVKFDI